MKSQKGITLMSLVVYVIVMTIAIAVIGSIISKFYNNTDSMQADTKEVIEFNKFNTYFLKEIKTSNNEVDKLDAKYMLFTSGNSFSYSNNSIYYNNIAICKNVKDITFSFPEEEKKDIINVNIKFDNFQKSLNYKIEEIY